MIKLKTSQVTDTNWFNFDQITQWAKNHRWPVKKVAGKLTVFKKGQGYEKDEVLEFWKE